MHENLSELLSKFHYETLGPIRNDKTLGGNTFKLSLFFVCTGFSYAAS